MGDLDLGGILVDADRLTNPALGYRVTVGVDRDVAVEIDDALEHFVDRWQRAGQALQVRLLDHVRRLGGHAQRALRFRIGDVATPGECLGVQVREVAEGAPRKEISLDIGERSLDASFAISMADTVGLETETEGAGEGGHLGGDHRRITGSGGDHHAGVVDDAGRANAVHEACGLEQELFGLEARIAGEVVDEQAPRVGEYERCALGSEVLAGDHHAVGRGVVLHLLAGGEDVFAGALRWGAQAGLSDPAGERAVGDCSPCSWASNSCARTTLPRVRSKMASSIASVCASHGGAALAWRSGARRMRRTVLRDSLSSRLISRKVRPCACRVRTALRISGGIMFAIPGQFVLQHLQRDAQAGQGARQRLRQGVGIQRWQAFTQLSDDGSMPRRSVRHSPSGPARSRSSAPCSLRLCTAWRNSRGWLMRRSLRVRARL